MTPETRNVEWKRWTIRNPAELRVDWSGSTTKGPATTPMTAPKLSQRLPEYCPKDVPKH